MDDGIAWVTVAVLGWTTWHLGGALGATMADVFPVWCGLLGLVLLRWSFVAPTGLPPGWWWPLPFLAYVFWQVREHAPLPGRAWLDGLQWGWMAIAFWIGLQVAGSPGPRRIVTTGVAIITLVAAAAAIYQRVFDPSWLPMGRVQGQYFLQRSSGVFGPPNTLAAWMLLVLPTALTVAVSGQRRRLVRGAAGLVVGAALLALVLSISRSAWLAGAAALLLWAWRWHPQQGNWGRRLACAGGIAVVLGVVALTAYRWIPTVGERVDLLVKQRGELTRPQMWQAAWGLWRDQPWVGTGAGSFEVLLERHRPAGFRDTPQWAHCDYLNTLSDYGVIGFGLSFGFMGWVLLGRGSQGRGTANERDRSALGCGLMGLAIATLVDFHLKIPAVAALAGLMAGAWVCDDGRRSDSAVKAPDFGFRGWGVGLLVLVGLMGFGWSEARPRWRAEHERFLGREAIERCAHAPAGGAIRPIVEPAIVRLSRAVGLDPRNDQAWADLSYGLVLQANWRPADARSLGQAAEAAARRALALSDVSWEYWVRLGEAMDLQDRWSDAGESFGRAVELAPNNHLAWYYQARHYARSRAGRPLARAAVAISLRLDPWNLDSNALRTALSRAE